MSVQRVIGQFAVFSHIHKNVQLFCRLVKDHLLLHFTSLVFDNKIRNGPLSPGTEYQFLQRGLDDKRKIVETVEWTPPVSTASKKEEDEEGPPVGVIVGVVVVVILVIVIVSAVLLYLRRKNSDEGGKPIVGK